MRHLFHISRRLKQATGNSLQSANGRLTPVPQRLFSLEKTQEEREKGAFHNFDLSQQTINLLESRNIGYLFPIQARSYNAIFSGRDLLGKDHTGSGKTLAFLLPVIEKLRRRDIFNSRRNLPKVLIMTPTRELAFQIEEEAKKLKHSHNEFHTVACVGGMPRSHQQRNLQHGVDIVVGTPGRIMDFMNAGDLKLSDIETVIFDEVDTMMDMGFRNDMNTILESLAQQLIGSQKDHTLTQFVMFSATIPRDIKDLVESFMKPNHEFVDMSGTGVRQLPKTISHYLHECDDHNSRTDTAIEVLRMLEANDKSVLVFVNTKRELTNLQSQIRPHFNCGVLYSEIDQKERAYWLKRFKEKSTKVLLCTNVASRGLDIPDIDVVVQIGLSTTTDEYVHRTGRTGRAGKDGKTIAFVTGDDEPTLDKINRIHKLKFKSFQGSEFEADVRDNFQRNKNKPRPTGPDSYEPVFQKKGDQYRPQSQGVFAGSFASGKSQFQGNNNNSFDRSQEGYQKRNDRRQLLGENNHSSQGHVAWRPFDARSADKSSHNTLDLTFDNVTHELNEVTQVLADANIIPSRISKDSKRSVNPTKSIWKVEFLNAQGVDQAEKLLNSSTLKNKPSISRAPSTV